jgi:hypothetical protein
MNDLATMTTAVRKILAETEAEYAQMPFFIRPMIKRGFAKRTGLDFAGWRIRLETVKPPDAALRKSLLALADHYRGAPERARKGMGATAEQLIEIEIRSRKRAETVTALALAL